MSASWKYPIFISYSRDDDQLTEYASALKAHFDRQLPATLRTTPGLGHLGDCKAFFDTTDVPTTGLLSKEVDEAVAQSFALMIVVDSGYVNSPWCLRELQQFRRKFNGQSEELTRRLFVVVVKATAEKELLAHKLWPKDLVVESIRRQFYDGSGPIPVRVTSKPGPGIEPHAVDNPDFTSKASKLVKRLVDLIAEQSDSVPPPPPAPNRPRRVLIGPTTSNVAEETARFITAAAHDLGIEADTLSLETLLRARASADLQARAHEYAFFIQPYTETTVPDLDSDAGGHLARVQKVVQNSMEIMWWRVPAAATAGPVASKDQLDPHQDFFNKVRPQARQRSAEELASDVANAIEGSESKDSALLFIESSREQHAEWQGVRKEVLAAWRKHVPNKRLMCSALPFNGRRTPELKALGDGHGVVLMYSNIDFNTLLARARLIEDILFEANATPTNFVAWLPKQPPQAPHEDHVWPTVAFDSTGSPRILALEPERLQELLLEVADKAARPKAHALMTE